MTDTIIVLAGYGLLVIAALVLCIALAYLAPGAMEWLGQRLQGGNE